MYDVSGRKAYKSYMGRKTACFNYSNAYLFEILMGSLFYHIMTFFDRKVIGRVYIVYSYIVA